MIIKENSTPVFRYFETRAGGFWFKQLGLRRIFLKAATAVFLAVVLLLSTTAIASTVALGEDADGAGGVGGDGDVTSDMAPQLWYLDSETTPAGREMEKSNGPGDDGQTGSVSIGPGNSELWRADQAAVVDVTFPSGSWVVEIRTDSDWGTEGDKCEVNVGGWDTDTGWYEIPTITVAKITWDDGFNIITILLQASSATIYQDDYLALKIKNNDSGLHVVCTEGRSSLRSPDTDPGYPVPELATGIFLGLGLLGLAGYLGLKKRKVTAINA